jgi:hypothetical protein
VCAHGSNRLCTSLRFPARHCCLQTALQALLDRICAYKPGRWIEPLARSLPCASRRIPVPASSALTRPPACSRNAQQRRVADNVHGLLADPEDPRHGQAKRVTESYERERFAGQPVLLSIFHCVGLFDHLASGDGLKALPAKPAIRRLTDALVNLSDDQRRCNVERLSEAPLLGPVDKSDPERSPAHPVHNNLAPAEGDERSGVDGSAQPLLRVSPRTTHEGKARTLPISPAPPRHLPTG